MRGKDANDLCMVRCFCNIEDRSLVYVKGHSPGIPLGFFEQNSKNCHACDQLESPLFVLTQSPRAYAFELMVHYFSIRFCLIFVCCVFVLHTSINSWCLFHELSKQSCDVVFFSHVQDKKRLTEVLFCVWSASWWSALYYGMLSLSAVNVYPSCPCFVISKSPACIFVRFCPSTRPLVW